MIPIAHPLCDKTFSKEIHNLVLELKEQKKLVTGIKACQKEILTGRSDILTILSGNTYPMDLITHIPILCEDRNIPYLFVESNEYLNGFTSVVVDTSSENPRVHGILNYIKKTQDLQK